MPPLEAGPAQDRLQCGPASGFKAVIAHCNPTDQANYGKIKNVQLTKATAMPAPQELSMSVLATSDVHGHALNWDYFTNSPYPAGEGLG